MAAPTPVADPPPLPEAERTALNAFVRRVLIVVGVAAAVAFLWITREAFLLAFGAVIVAVLLTVIATPIDRMVGLRRRWSLLLAIVILVAVLGAVGMLVGTEVVTQVGDLLERLPQAVRAFEERLNIDLSEAAGASGLGGAAPNLLGSVTQWGATALGALSSLVIVLVGGVFLAADPAGYRDGLVALFPERQQPRVAETLDTNGRALMLWLIGQLMAMALIGLLYGIGAWAIGLPAPLALGLFAAVTEFVPVVGPVVGAIPALLLAAGQGADALLWALALVVVVQQMESNVISPIIERRLVTIPPALFLFAIVAFGLLFGTVGIVVAAPLTVVAFVTAKKLYVRETLGQPASVPGEKL